MPLGELKINGIDAYAKYRLSLEDGAKAVLMTPAPNKERAKNRSRLRHGEEIAGSLERKDSREVSLPMHITAKTSEIGLSYYKLFCEVLDKGILDIEYSGLPDTVFHFRYISCSDFRTLYDELMKFTLKLEEPNPNDRTAVEEVIEEPIEEGEE